MKKPSILVLSASTGNGHLSAAEAITREAKARGLKAEHIDVLDHVSPAFRKWYRGGYEVLVRKRPAAWGHLYKTSDKKRFNYYFQTALDTQFCKRLEVVLKKWRPDWVVCTHSLPQPVLERFREEYGFKVAVTVTDLYVHRMWLRGHVDLYFVPQTWSEEVLQERLPNFPGQIEVTGIPVNDLFSEEISKKDARSQIGQELSIPLSEKRWVLMSSGGIGGGPLEEAASALSKVEARVVVICGRNAKMKTALEAATESMANVTVLGAVSQEQMARLMKASDLLVSKPGGLTTFEALTVGIPFVVFWPFLIPGQEEGNAEFLEESGAGVIVRDAETLGRTVADLIKSESLLEQMSRAGLAQAQPDATRKIVDHLMDVS